MDESFGSILYRINKREIEYLVIHLKKSNYWGIPKGHPEGDESLVQTVIREIREETGCEILIHSDFKNEIFYSLQNGIQRKVTFLLSKAILENKSIIFSDEISDTIWLSYEKAHEKLTFENSKSVLKSANLYLTKNNEKIKNKKILNLSKRKAINADQKFIYETKREGLYPYVKEIWGWDEEFQKKRFNETLKIENIHILMHSLKPIGILEIENDNNVVNLVNIEFIETKRNQGIGSLIIEELKEKAVEKNKIVNLRVFKNNEKAIIFYKRQGFTVTNQSEYHLNMTFVSNNENVDENKYINTP